MPRKSSPVTPEYGGYLKELAKEKERRRQSPSYVPSPPPIFAFSTPPSSAEIERGRIARFINNATDYNPSERDFRIWKEFNAPQDYLPPYAYWINEYGEPTTNPAYAKKASSAEIQERARMIRKNKGDFMYQNDSEFDDMPVALLPQGVNMDSSDFYYKYFDGPAVTEGYLSPRLLNIRSPYFAGGRSSVIAPVYPIASTVYDDPFGVYSNIPVNVPVYPQVEYGDLLGLESARRSAGSARRSAGSARRSAGSARRSAGSARRSAGSARRSAGSARVSAGSARKSLNRAAQRRKWYEMAGNM
jgi:hypothetical protein